MYQLDEKPEGFEWINGMEWEKNLLIFLRRTRKKEDTLLVVCNFSNVEYDDFRIGVPYPGKYKEMFNSDAESYGGTGVGNPRVKMSKKTECDERKNSITVKLAPLSVQVFSYTKPETGAASNKSAKAKTAAESGNREENRKEGKTGWKNGRSSKSKENNKDCPKSREKGIGKNGENRREKAGNYDCDREGGESRKAGDRQQTGENGRADSGQAGESRKIRSGRGSKSRGKIPRSRRSGKEAGYKAGNQVGSKIRGKTRDKNEKKHRHE